MQSRCKTCVAIRNKRYKEDHKNYTAAYNKKYNETHREEIKELRGSHKEELAAYGKKYREDNPEKEITRHKKYRETHRKEASESGKQYDQTEAGKTSRRKRSHKRRALKAGANMENFNPIKVLERDRYKCQLCGRKTRPDFNPYHPLYPNVDHIVPLSMGGDHTRGNTQCLCRQCNLEKGSTGMGDQLRLFG